MKKERVNMNVGTPLAQPSLSAQLEGLQQDLQHLLSLIPDAVKFAQKPAEPIEIISLKRFEVEKNFIPCSVTPELKINWFRSEDQPPLEVNSRSKREIDHKEIDEVKLETIVVENTPFYKCTVVLLNGDKINFRSSSLERINSLFKMLQPPVPCKILNLRKTRVAYNSGLGWLEKGLYDLLRDKFAIELRKEPEGGKIGKNHVLFFVMEGSPARQPQQPDLDSWIYQANIRSGGNGVYLLVEFSGNQMSAQRIPGSGIFMNEPQKRKPVVLRILRQQERGASDIGKLADEIAQLVDQVSGTGLEKASI
jgi:hypothetical protein